MGRSFYLLKIIYYIRLLTFGFLISAAMLTINLVLLCYDIVPIEIISAGMIFSYIVPCYIAGCIIRKYDDEIIKHKTFAGILYGIIFSLLLIGASVMCNKMTGAFSLNKGTVILLCSIISLAGTVKL